jgi:thiol peroxidase
MARKVTFKGNPVALSGDGVAVGAKAPQTPLITNDLASMTVGAPGKVTVLVVVPSLDTSVCDMESRRFNQEAASLPGDIQVLVVSRDLPFAQKRWCGNAGIDKVQTLSDFRDRKFGDAWGLTIAEGPLSGLLARAVYVIDAGGTVRYAELVPEIGQEPHYDAALKAAREAASAKV